MVNHGKPVTIWFVNSFGWFLKPTIKAISSKILILCFDERFGSGSPRDSRSTPSKKAMPEASTCFDCQGAGFLRENTRVPERPGHVNHHASLANETKQSLQGLRTPPIFHWAMWFTLVCPLKNSTTSYYLIFKVIESCIPRPLFSARHDDPPMTNIFFGMGWNHERTWLKPILTVPRRIYEQALFTNGWFPKKYQHVNHIKT